MDIVLIIVIVFTIFFSWMALHLHKKLQKNLQSKEENRKKATTIGTGVIAGVIVIILDRIVTWYLANVPKVEWASGGTFLKSLLPVLIMAFFTASVVLALVLWALYLGTRGKSE